MQESVRALLEGVIDYAGLFPPAGLSLPEAMANYGRYLAGEYGWMMGRFIVPVSRLAEFETLLATSEQPRQWRLSVLTGPDLAASIPAVLAFNAHVRAAVIDSLEATAGSPEAVAGWVPEGFTAYFEIPAEPDPAPLIQAIASAKGRAKIRAGGVKENLFPSVAEVARFIRRCDEAKVAFKATAGLHHPLRGTHPLTDGAGSASCAMHGFLNVLLASAFSWSGISDEETQALLAEEDWNFTISSRGVGWRRHWIAAEQIRSARERLIVSFGSCSFEEPIADLKARGVL